ncbi:hypothetical protein M1367_03580 [Candidatus Marsarchaeota archaeon]|jgi:hypothetical protein|nr:hypothetical protein [Candidatus Marsarchaeota archaeon]
MKIESKTVFIAGIAAIVFGILLTVYGYANYYAALCYCPANGACRCINAFAKFCLETGNVLSFAVGAWWLVLAIFGSQIKTKFTLRAAAVKHNK